MIMRQSAVGIVVGPHVLNIYTYITTLNKRRGAYTCNTYYISALFVRLNLRIDTCILFCEPTRGTTVVGMRYWVRRIDGQGNGV